jgi:type III pantothenate kinase
MWLAIDIGNTNIHIGIFKEDVLSSTYSVTTESLSLHPEQLSKIPVANILHKATAVIISSVNPQTTALVVEYIQSRLLIKPQHIGKDIPLPIPILTENPERVGVDRLVNALAAFERIKNWAIVVDAGTAITIDAINDTGAFLGGVIAPGINMASKSLHNFTALLPEVSINKPAHVIGKSTVDAIKSGIYWGTAGMITHLITLFCNELECQPTVIATGGNAEMLAKEIPRISDVFPYLTLEGIQIAYKAHLASNTQR